MCVYVVKLCEILPKTLRAYTESVARAIACRNCKGRIYRVSIVALHVKLVWLPRDNTTVEYSSSILLTVSCSDKNISRKARSVYKYTSGRMYLI